MSKEKLSNLRFYKPNQYEQQDNDFEQNEPLSPDLSDNDYRLSMMPTSNENELMNKNEKITQLYSSNNVQSPSGNGVNNYYQPQQDDSEQFNRYMPRQPPPPQMPMPVPLSHPSHQKRPYFNDKHNSQVYVDQTDFELPRLFITNVNKNLNINDLDKTDHIKDQDLNNYKAYKTHKLSMKSKNMTTTVQPESNSTHQSSLLLSSSTNQLMTETTTPLIITETTVLNNEENKDVETTSSLISSL